MNLATATPVEIDTELARLNGLYIKLTQDRANEASTAHRLNGERAVYQGRRRVYTMPLDTTLVELALKLADKKILSHEVRKAHEVIGRIAEIDKQIEANNAETELIDVEYARRPWLRFVSVEDGHVHSGRHCAKGTIRVTTKIGWHPELSGKTEAEAVAELGPLLCTHCFPTAPVEWTVGKPKTDRCEGSGKDPKGACRRIGRSYYGDCTGCGEEKMVTQYGAIKAHKPKKD